MTARESLKRSIEDAKAMKFELQQQADKLERSHKFSDRRKLNDIYDSINELNLSIVDMQFELEGN